MNTEEQILVKFESVFLTFSLTKMRLKMSFAKSRSSCLGLDVIKDSLFSNSMLHGIGALETDNPCFNHPHVIGRSTKSTISSSLQNVSCGLYYLLHPHILSLCYVYFTKVDKISSPCWKIEIYSLYASSSYLSISCKIFKRNYMGNNWCSRVA